MLVGGFVIWCIQLFSEKSMWCHAQLSSFIARKENQYRPYDWGCDEKDALAESRKKHA